MSQAVSALRVCWDKTAEGGESKASPGQGEPEEIAPAVEGGGVRIRRPSQREEVLIWVSENKAELARELVSRAVGGVCRGAEEKHAG